jgi:hypothetical protein
MQFKQRIGDDDERVSQFRAPSRRGKHARPESPERPHKKTRHNILTTTFAPTSVTRPQTTSNTQTTPFPFKVKTCTIDERTSAPTIDQELEYQDGAIATSTLTLSPDDQGITKDVYEVV